MSKHRPTWVMCVLAPLALLSIFASTANAVSPVRSCASLLLIAFDDGTKVTSAAEIPANGSTPAHCQVTLLVPDRINIAVLLPTQNWNGRYQAIGNGGYAGTIGTGMPGLPTAAVAQGYVTSATDTGHQGTVATGEWAWSPLGMNTAQIQDFAYRANHEMAVKSKSLISYFYGRGPSYSYWNGCSTGGREGLTEAMRYPKDFDGIMAAAPAINWTKFIPAEMWPQVVMKEMGHLLPVCKQQAIAQIVHAACDMSDGVQDGLIDTLRCPFPANELIGQETSCGTLTASDAAVIQKIWEGPRRQSGQFLWYGLEPGSDTGSIPNMTGSTPTMTLALTVPDIAPVDGVPFAIANDWFKWWLHKDPLFDWHTLTFQQFEQDFDQSVAEWADVLATNNPNLSEFRANGGKIVIWHGMADQLIFPRGSINYYERVLATMGSARTLDFARLFLAADVMHCTGGIGPAPADPLAAVVAWREQGRAPDRLLATLPAGTGVNTTNEVMTRPLCPYPQVAVYKGSGSIYKEENFDCKRSAPR